MSYAGRMYRRMFLPSVLTLAAGSLAAAGAKAVQEMPGQAGMLSLYSNLPAWLFVAGLGIALFLAAVQLIRIRLWERGALAACYVCGCLLGAPRSAPRGLGTARECLGCGKVHGTNHRISTQVVPLAVAVQDTVVTPVRSVR